MLGIPSSLPGLISGYGGGTFNIDGTQATPVNRFPVGQTQTVSEPFVWGEGGRRMTPEDIAIQRRIAASLMSQGADFSPVGHWTQGLARAAQGLMGGLRERKADKAAQVNAAESDAVLQALMGGGQTGDRNAELMAAMSNPYITDEARQLAKMEYDRLNPKPSAPTDIEKYGALAGWTPEQIANAANQALLNKIDPFTNIVIGGNSVSGRQSLVERALEAGASSPTGAQPPSTLPPDFDFGGGGSGNATGGFR